MDEFSIHDVFLKGLEDALVCLATYDNLALLAYCKLSKCEVKVMGVEDDVEVSPSSIPRA